MSTPSIKKAKTHPDYELLYHPGIPGRGEYVRLAFEAAGVSYTDPANEDKKSGYPKVRAIMNPKETEIDGNPICFAPPGLRIPGAGKNGGDLVIHQTPNILFYLGPKLGLAGDDEVDALHANQIMLTALDLSNETHDTHHPVAVMDYYEDQKPEALKKATDFRKSRLPKFFSYFERVLKSNEELGQGKYMVGSKLTVADTTVWQVIDGLMFAFPMEMEARAKDYPLLFTIFYPNFKEEERLKSYLSSKKRLPYSMGLYRHYPELDRQ